MSHDVAHRQRQHEVHGAGLPDDPLAGQAHGQHDYDREIVILKNGSSRLSVWPRPMSSFSSTMMSVSGRDMIINLAAWGGHARRLVYEAGERAERPPGEEREAGPAKRRMEVGKAAEERGSEFDSDIGENGGRRSHSGDRDRTRGRLKHLFHCNAADAGAHQGGAQRSDHGWNRDGAGAGIRTRASSLGSLSPNR